MAARDKRGSKFRSAVNQSTVERILHRRAKKNGEQRCAPFSACRFATLIFAVTLFCRQPAFRGAHTLMLCRVHLPFAGLVPNVFWPLSRIDIISGRASNFIAAHYNIFKWQSSWLALPPGPLLFWRKNAKRCCVPFEGANGVQFSYNNTRGVLRKNQVYKQVGNAAANKNSTRPTFYYCMHDFINNTHPSSRPGKHRKQQRSNAMLCIWMRRFTKTLSLASGMRLVLCEVPTASKQDHSSEIVGAQQNHWPSNYFSKPMFRYSFYVSNCKS